MNETKVIEEKAVAVFNKFDAQLKEWVEKSKTVVFDLEDKKQNKEARSFVANIRKSKKPINEAHKLAKAESLAFGRMLDSEKNRIIAAIDEVIDVYAVPLKELEELEEKRIANIKNRVDEIHNLAHSGDDSIIFNSDKLKENMDLLNGITIDDSFDEFIELAQQAKDDSIAKLEALIASVTKQEEDAKELALLKQQQAEREQAEREEEIRVEAAEKAKKDAEEEAEKQRLELQLKAEKAEREKQEAINKAEREKQEAIENERKRAEKEKREAEEIERAEKLAAEKKAANRNHQRKINNESLADFKELGIDNAEEVIRLIAQNKIRNITINY